MKVSGRNAKFVGGFELAALGIAVIAYLVSLALTRNPATALGVGGGLFGVLNLLAILGVLLTKRASTDD
jgi:hypothetical protein